MLLALPLAKFFPTPRSNRDRSLPGWHVMHFKKRFDVVETDPNRFPTEAIIRNPALLNPKTDRWFRDTNHVPELVLV
jgi:hypothetical protein